VKERVDANSKAEGFTTSRLPKFTSEEVNFIKGKISFTDKIAYLMQLRILSGVSIHIHDANYEIYYTYFYVSGRVRERICGTAICNGPTVH